MAQIDWHIDAGLLGELPCLVSYDYTPAERGSMYDRNGDPGNPPSPEEITIYSITVFLGNVGVDIDPKMYRAIFDAGLADEIRDVECGE